MEQPSQAPNPPVKDMSMRPFNKIESLAMLQQPLDTAPRSEGESSSVVGPDATPKPVSMNLAFRRLRLVFVATIMLAAIVAITLVFHHGVEITRFDEMNSTEKDDMVNRYNSYTGYVATALGKPVDLFVTTTIQVVALQLLASQILTIEPSWTATFSTLMATAGIGYLVANGFNSLNAQGRDSSVIPVISSTDLTAADFVNAWYINMTSNLTESVPEAQSGNPTTNTVLRNLVLPRVFKAPLKCTIGGNSTVILQDDAVDFGLSQRDWMKWMLTDGVNNSQTMRIIVNPTDPNANANLQATDMPMNASRAAYLLLNTMFLSSQFVPWGQNRTWDDDDDLLKPYQTEATNPERNVSTAILAGVLPANADADEATKRVWFLNASGAVLTDRFQETTVTKLTDIPMDLTHIELSPDVRFDAMSFEIDVQPSLLTSVTINNKTRYLNLRNTQCGPYPGRCLIAKRDQPPSKPVMPVDLLYDAPVQIHAFGICLDDNGTEALQSTIRFGGKFDDLNVNYCPSVAKGSMLLVSVAKRLVADELLQNTSASATGLSTNPNSTVVTNLRKIYTFTVARFGWSMRNLSAEFHAECNDTKTNCMGLTFDLDPDETGTNQKVVIGKSAMPDGYLTTPVYSAWATVARQRPMTLVQVNEPPKTPSMASLADESGDVLLPHNIKKIQWNDFTTRLKGDKCSMYTEDRLQLILNNHMYMEEGLQSTYTAGMFFLFQKSVVRDVLAMGAKNASLKFDNNIQQVIVWVSIPSMNAYLTLGGCLVLAFGVLLVVMWPQIMAKKRTTDPFTDITQAHVIAQVMLNEDAFPPLLVQRRVVHKVGVDNEKTSPEEDVDKYIIGQVALHPHDEQPRSTRGRATSLA